MELGLVALSDALRSKNEIAAVSWDPSGWLEIPPHGGVEGTKGARRDEVDASSHGRELGHGNAPRFVALWQSAAGSGCAPLRGWVFTGADR